MAVAYTKDFLVDAFLSRYRDVPEAYVGQNVKFIKMTNDFYDEVGKDKFRVWASLDPAAIREYKALKI